MAYVGISLNINADELRDFRDRVQNLFRPREAADVLGEVIRKAIKPTTQRLRQLAPVGPTGNLKRAVTSKVVKYRQDGAAVGLVGFSRAGRGSTESAAGGSVRSGKDRAFHQWWIEYGTKERKITRPQVRRYQRRSPTTPFGRFRRGQWEAVAGKGVLHTVQEQTPTYIASSFNRLGPFKILRVIGGDGRVQTDPPYPRAFFRKSNQPIVIPETPAGGVAGKPPLNTAFFETQEQVAAILQRELSLTLSQAWVALRFRDSGTVSGTDTLGPA